MKLPTSRYYLQKWIELKHENVYTLLLRLSSPNTTNNHTSANNKESYDGDDTSNISISKLVYNLQIIKKLLLLGQSAIEIENNIQNKYGGLWFDCNMSSNNNDTTHDNSSNNIEDMNGYASKIYQPLENPADQMYQ